MSYNREPMCRYCWRRGHTKRTCPDLPDYQKQYYAESIKNRACTHCTRSGYEGGQGHNKRTCVRLKEDKQYYINDIIVYRKMIFEKLRTHNIGPGTLVSIHIPRWARWGLKEGVENEIFVLKRFIVPNSFDRIAFEAISTLTNEKDTIRLNENTIGAEMIVPSTNPRRENSHYITHYSPYDTKMEILTQCEPDIHIASMSDLLDQNTVQFPKYLD